ncbi:V-type ATP synthase subunit E [Miniphocaeibacter massiliensis]|uniref:V-type ATP synthase subunit E n=1 Tax=Miniphocaeibacter massiliensis TaxID=2041841 RepID=UPI000C087C20|nr:V-type ATP synthase subunit E [Miniphocaeibacter massiliensis]
MSNLDNIIQTLLNDSEKESNKILQEANSNRDKYIQNKEKTANEMKLQIISKAREEAKNLTEKASNSANLKARDKILEAKQRTVSKVLLIVKDKLKNMDDKTYTNILLNTLKKSEVDSDYLIKVQKDKLDSVKALGLNNEISNEFVDSGFAFVGKSSIINNDFSNLVDYMSDDLEGYIAGKLFVE